IKAMLTVALIPPILKHVFGLEKGKSKKTATEPANNNYYNLTQKAKMAQFLGSTESIKKGAAPSFSGNIPVSSPFLKTPQKLFNKLIDNIEKYYTSYAFSNPLTRKLAHKDDIGRWVDHMQAFGSYTVSGMYMLQTLRNKNMDEDRRTTLAINQGLTLVASTAIAYLVSEKLIAPWNKHVSMKYAASKLNMDPEELSKGLKEHQQKIKKLYFEKHPDQITRENINEKTMKKLYKKKHGSLAGFEEYIDDLIKNKSLELDLKKFKKPNLVHYVDKALKNKGLADKLKGLDVLKSLIIFTSVYRFFGPVLVTPVATWIGNQITKIKKNKKQKSEPAPITPPPTTTNNNKTIYNTMQKPSISQFGVVNKNNAA
ncbi:hypothetical protein IJ596_07140, partial [bacterium]|nr:hypothetical protein [bacterium]